MKLGKYAFVCPCCGNSFSTVLIRFLSHVQKTDTCWNWGGGNDGQFGYGKFRLGDKLYRAHRVSWMLHKGQIPRGLDVLHKCIGNPKCVNPDHLYLGTDADNVRDIILQSRRPPRGGSASNFAVLTDQDIVHIRASTDENGVLAKRHNVTTRTIWRIRTGETWKHRST